MKEAFVDDDVCKVLEDADASDYAANFEYHRITSDRLLSFTDDDLIRAKQLIGVHALGAREAILRVLEKYKAKQNVSLPEPSAPVDEEVSEEVYSTKSLEVNIDEKAGLSVVDLALWETSSTFTQTRHVGFALILMDLYKRAQEMLEDVSGGNLKWMILIPTGVYLFYRVLRWCYVEIQLPPGPIGWPWLGYTRCLGDDAFKELQVLRQKYGPVVSFRLCGKIVIGLSDEESIKEAALKRRNLTGRHTMLTNHLLAKGFGITNYDGENAAFSRRIFVRALNQFLPKGVRDIQAKDTPTDDANLQVDSDLNSECSKVVDFLRQKNGEPVKISSVLRRLSWNVLWKATFGTECKLDDDTIADLIQCIAENNADNGPLQLKQMLPTSW
ncbi:unnamed protein product [Mesocestoides corti]|uniref:SAM domain-containing protein n=2 Tax=Mesocestoides corti TaxID=53468 RepID=A0A3P6GFM4_MESCO|nr:unnamed protein product [Mesocestoides corti]